MYSYEQSRLLKFYKTTYNKQFIHLRKISTGMH